MTDRRAAAARDSLYGSYPEATGSTAQVALGLIQTVARAVGAPPASLGLSPGEQVTPTVDPAVEHVLAALILLRWLDAELDAWEPHLIAAARERGASWADLAAALGVASRQAAERRYLRMSMPDQQDTPTTTREERVDAERDRRAGQRAISRWARDNGAELRQLAGQVTALTDLDPEGQASVGRLYRALTQADPTSLVPLLADTHRHLLTEHPALAERVNTITYHADRVRRTVQRQRKERRNE
ncbi:MAG TPA: hypothetical protein VFR67_25575 [Pilimelia sp.]|nr:hypothetical protein [Pilimelia sp.]